MANPFAWLAAWWRPTRPPIPLPAHYANHAPACLGDLARVPPTPEIAPLVASGPRWAIFGLACPCGSPSGELHGRRTGDGPLNGPLGFRCLACGEGRSLFDPVRHGEAGERMLVGKVVGGEPEAAACPLCEWNEFRLAAGFDFGPSAFDDPARDDFHGRAEDFFVGMRIAGRCTQCGRATLLAEADCRS